MGDASCGNQLLPIDLTTDMSRLTALHGLLSEIDYPAPSIYVDLGAGRRIDAASRGAGSPSESQQSRQAVSMDCDSCTGRPSTSAKSVD